MAWLLCDGQPVASLEIADAFRTRLRGLLGRESMEGALMVTKTSSVHTLGMKFPIDVAFCDKSMLVTHVVTMKRNRVGLPRLGSTCVIEASSGAFERWGLRQGSTLEIKT